MLLFGVGYVETVGAVLLLTKSLIGTLFNVALIFVMVGALSLHIVRNEQDMSIFTGLVSFLLLCHSLYFIDRSMFIYLFMNIN